MKYICEEGRKEYTDDEFDELCFKFGIELDEITSEKKMAMKEKGVETGGSDEVIYKIDIPANRYDLLCLEGLALALNVFTGKMSDPPEYVIKPVTQLPNRNKVEFFVDENVAAVRPVLLAAVVLGVDLKGELYDSFLELQDKIHQTIGRNRSIVSIGTHDLNTVEGPFLYTAIKPENLKFTPLNQNREMNGAEIMEHYKDSHLKPYLHIIKDKPVYPVILDKNKTVLSMPPIINGDVSKLTADTKDILIEITATDRDKATIAMASLISMLTYKQGTGSKTKAVFEAYSVKITGSDNTTYTTPNMSYHKEKIDIRYINQGLGLNLQADEIAKLLKKMSIKAKVIPDENIIEIEVGPTRHDVIHKCDIMEDVGIAYGYDNIEKTLPKSATIATQVPLNKMGDQLRQEIARCGYTEALNFALCSEAEISTMLMRPNVENLVRIQNPKTAEFQVARTCLLTGLLKTLNSNKKLPLPLKLFEVGDVVLKDSNYDVGARNRRHLAAVYYGKQTSGFETIHGLLDRLMQVLDVPYIGELPDKETKKQGFYIVATDEDKAYLPGRCAAVVYNGKKIGYLGILHPVVLANFELNHPVSSLEISIEEFPFVNPH